MNRKIRWTTTPVFGKATFEQRNGDKHFSVSGELKTDKAPGFVSFQPTSGSIMGQSITFTYLNSRGEKGLASGIISESVPSEFTVFYSDAFDSDDNDDPSVRIQFTRITE